MPAITITGNPGKGNNSGEGDGSSEQGGGNFIDAYNSRRIETSYNKLRSQQRQEATWQNQNFDSVRRHYQAEAKLENANFDLLRKHAQVEARWEDQNHNMRRRQQRQEADYHNKSIDARTKRQQQADQNFLKTYAAASRENARYDSRSAAASYHAMRYNADRDNTSYDIANRPGPPGPRYRRGRHFGYGMSQAGRALEGRSGGLGGIGRAASTFGEAGSLAGGLEAGALGPIGIGGLAAFDVLKAAYNLPGKVSGMIDDMLSQAAPYMAYQRGTSAIGNAGGYGADALRNSLFNRTGPLPWESRYGLGPQSALDIYSAYGNRGDSAGMLRGVVSASAQADQTAYLGGLGASRYAAGLGQYETLLGPSYIQASADADTNSPDSDSNASTDKYFSRLQRVMAKATSLGLDHSKVADTMQGMLQIAASSGSANINPGGLANLWGRLAGSGAANMRDGSGVLSAMSSLSGESSSLGYSGNTIGNMALQRWVNQKGGMQSTAAGVAKQLGIGGTPTPQQSYLISNAVDAAKQGNVLAYASSIKSMLTPSQMLDADIQYTGGMGLTGAAQTAAIASMSGMPVSDVAAYLSQPSGGNLPDVPGSVKYGRISDYNFQAIMDAAKATGVDPRSLLATAAVESNFGNDPNASKGGHGGILEVTRDTFNDGQKNGYIDRDVTWDQVQSDPRVGALVGAEVWKQKSKGGKSALQTALAYNGGGNGKYGQLWGAAYDNLGNLNLAQNGLLSKAQTLDMGVAEQVFKTTDATFGGSLGDSVISLAGNVATASDSVAAFASAVQKAMAEISGGHDKGWTQHPSGNSFGGGGFHGFKTGHESSEFTRPGGARGPGPKQA
ncbi:transglycosylase SLT domain-containing protein [Acidisoma sp. L85]|uniref:transglycosylase SLT domain-containing protein n=1 Tax=Acidisoma sp. L85 TaxID=1641850 RepID=UPI00131CEA8A|nr:transglycosylase SLT domain-containing protein [Acidisoma sp. L85]